MKEKPHDLCILVVEDELPLRKAIQTKLERRGFNALVATRVEQAIMYLEDTDVPVDAVWLDHYLFGKKDGLDMIAHMQEKGLMGKVPVFVVTNTGGHDKKESYMALGATEYYVKSNSRLDSIVEDIENYLRKQ